MYGTSMRVGLEFDCRSRGTQLDIGESAHPGVFEFSSTPQTPLQQQYSSLFLFDSDQCFESASYRSEIERLTPNYGLGTWLLLVAAVRW